MKVSVVVPLYNNEQYIGRCIDSLLAQDYNNYEIIIVDDGSTDSSFETAQQFQSEKVKIFSKVNGGPSFARNFGISKCSGDSEYLFFVDSDDTVAPNYISSMVKYAAPNRLVLCGVNHLHSRPYNTPPQENLNKKAEQTKVTVVRDIWSSEKFIGCLPSGIVNPCWNKCYSLSLIRKANIQFEPTLPEDIRFNLDYLKQCNDICFLNDRLYNYIHRDGSVSGKPLQSLYDGYIQIQKELYTAVPPRYHYMIDEFVYPQYLANTRRFLRAGDFITPRIYMRNPLIKKAISSHKSTCLGDGVMKYLFKYGFLELLMRI